METQLRTRGSTFTSGRNRWMARGRSFGMPRRPTFRRGDSMRTIAGIVLAGMGAIWFLQRINVLPVGRSPMIGDVRWAYYGAAAVVIGLALVLSGRRR